MLCDGLLFCLLAVVTNAVLPLPFEPVLLTYASRYPASMALPIALIGSACAGVGGYLEVRLAWRVRRRVSPHWLRLLPSWDGAWVYVWTFTFALLPLPFTLIRVALLKARPKALLYSLSVTLGRLPRYILLLSLWHGLALPGWIASAALAVAVALFLARRPRVQQEGA